MATTYSRQTVAAWRAEPLADPFAAALERYEGACRAAYRARARWAVWTGLVGVAAVGLCLAGFGGWAVGVCLAGVAELGRECGAGDY